MKWQEWSALAEDTLYWQNREEKGLLKAEYIRDYILRLWFDDEQDVSVYELDFRPLFVEDNPGGVFEALRNRRRFSTARGDYALIWPNPETGDYDDQSVDLAPECVRFFSERYGTGVKASEKMMMELA
jgi:hypothetical protein